MPSYTIVENEQFIAQIVTPGLLGANFVTSFDFELADSTALLDTLQSMGISTLRFPGGSVTEDSFAEAAFLTGNWDAESYFDGTQTQTLTPLVSFFEAAGYVGADVQLVIPTRVAFEQSAGEALQAGEFGTRTELRSDYLDLVDRYVSEALALAADAGTQITHVEIGNEFWGSGEMSSAEYGYLAGILTAHLSEEHPNLEVFIQIVSSSNAFTPSLDSLGYLEPDGNGDYNVYPGIYLSELPQDHWIEVIIPGTGNSYTSNQKIAENFTRAPGAVENLSGVINHVYFGLGFAGIDGERDFALQTSFNRFIDLLGVPVELDYLISEWSPRGPNTSGLQYAHTVIEGFFELVSNGIDYANFWPTTFANPLTLGRSLIDSIEGDLTFGGVAFNFLSQTEGMRPIFDFEVDAVVDLHGYASEDEMIVYLAERSGAASTTPIEISLANFTSSANYFVTYTHLVSADGNATENRSNPLVTVSSDVMTEGSLLLSDLQPFEIVMIELQAITDNGDHIDGSVSDDLIDGNGGNDTIFGGDGHDTLNGRLDSDELFGESGNDLIRGGWGHDTLDGGQGADTLLGQFGNDLILGQLGDDLIFGHDGDDVLLGHTGADSLDGGDGSDLVDGGAGADNINGGSDNDTLVGGAGDDIITGGEGDDLIHSGDGSGTVDGGVGFDTLSFADLTYSVSVWDMEQVVEVGFAETGFSLLNYAEIEAIEGTQLSDRFQIFRDDVEFKGLSGDDSFAIMGGARVSVHMGVGDDSAFIYGEAKAEVFGGEGDDSFFVFRGESTVSGGVGDDEYQLTSQESTTIQFGLGDGNDIVHNFEKSLDRITFNDLDASSVTFEADIRGTEISLHDGSSVLLVGVSISENFDFVQFV
jgi:serralysin